MWLLYLIIAFTATLFGSLTGMGGGVFIKPILDFFGKQNVESIAFLSSATVLVMSIVTLFKQRKTNELPKRNIVLPLSIGAVVGGISGERLFGLLVENASSTVVKITQNTILIVLIMFIFVYMFFKERLPSMHLNGKIISLLTGSLLGLISSFLGIGGGPINVALIIFLFSFSTKTAMLCSLITILFSQTAKLTIILLYSNIAEYDLNVLPVMLLGGVLGGFLGGTLNKFLTDKLSGRLFCVAQIVVICICILNIVKSI